MTNSTLIRPAHKTRVQALKLALYEVKIVGGDSVLQVANKDADLRNKRADP
jgi:hypothetical protein